MPIKAVKVPQTSIKMTSSFSIISIFCINFEKHVMKGKTFFAFKIILKFYTFCGQKTYSKDLTNSSLEGSTCQTSTKYTGETICNKELKKLENSIVRISTKSE